MSKVQVGDYVYVDYLHKNGTVIGDRGGHVGRYCVKFDDGGTCQASARDCTVIKTSRYCYPNSRVSVAQKLDLLLDHLGLEIDETVRLVERQTDEKKSD